MSNTLLTVKEIAMEAVMRLENNLVMGGLVHTNYSDSFANKGDTITIRKPATFTAQDFTSAISAQAVTESSVDVSLSNIADVSVEVTAKEMALNIQDFSSQILDGAMQAIAQKVDYTLLQLYKDIPYLDGTAGTTPSALSNIANVGKKLNANKCPTADRRLVMDTEAQAKLVILDAIAGADKSGSTDALRNANMGRILGLDTYMDQNIATHTKGTLAATTGTLAVSSAAAGDTQVVIAATACAGTLKAGDIITIADTSGTYVVTELATASSNSITAKIYPALASSVSAKEVTVIGSHVSSLGFHKNAFAFVTRPMALPMGGAEGYIANYKGLPIRVTMGYTMSSKINTISFDLLYGVKTLNKELAARMIG